MSQQTSSDMLKVYGMQVAHAPTQPSDPNVDLLTQSLLIDDTELKRILKGEIQEPLNKFRELVQMFNQVLVEAAKTEHFDATNLNEIRLLLKDANPLLQKIDARLGRYYRMVPYLMMLSPLTRLSNLSGKDADSLARKVGIMVGRDMLMSSDEDGFEDRNFFDALLIQCRLAIYDSRDGWKFRGITQEMRKVETVIQDNTGRPRKKRWGLF